MKMTSKLILTILALAMIIALPACRTRKQPAEPVVAPAPAPEVAPPPAAEPVTEPKDFVVETPAPREVEFPSDMEEMNRFAQREGFIRDAFYNYDEATLDDAAQAALTTSANWLKSSRGAGYNLLIEGHCDERGTEQYNLALGDRRANSAKDYLVTLGVDAGRIRTVSYGEERPFEEGHNDSSWAQNRRAHLVLVR